MVRLLAILLALPLIAAGCIEAPVTPASVEELGILAAPTSAFHTSLPAGGAAAYRLSVTEDDWVKDGDFSWVYLMVEWSEVEEGGMVAVQFYELEDGKMRAIGSGSGSGNGKSGIGWGTSAAPRAFDVIVVLGTDGPASTARVGIVEGFNADIPKDAPHASPLASGTGTRISLYFEFSDIVFGPYAQSRDVEIQDTRSNGPPIGGTLDVTADHDLEQPHTRIAYGFTGGNGAYRWGFSCDVDGKTQQSSGTAAYIGSGFAWCEGDAQDEGAFTMTYAGIADVTPTLVLVANAMPIDVATMGYTIENDFSASKSVIPLFVTLNGVTYSLTAEGPVLAPHGFATSIR